MTVELSWSAFLTLNMKFWQVAIPAVSSQLIILLVETISMIFVGRLNNAAAIAGVGLAMNFVNILIVILYGLN